MVDSHLSLSLGPYWREGSETRRPRKRSVPQTVGTSSSAHPAGEVCGSPQRVLTWLAVEVELILMSQSGLMVGEVQRVYRNAAGSKRLSKRG